MNAFWLKYLPRRLKDRLNGKHHLQQAMGNSGWLLFDKIIRVAIGLAIGIWMARAMGPAQFGQLNYALAFVSLFTPIAGLGLDSIVTRNLVTTSDHPSSILGTAAVLKLTGTINAFILCNLISYLLIPGDAMMRELVMIIAIALLFQPVDVIDFWFQSRVASKYTVLAKLPPLLAFSAIRIGLILSLATVTAYAWAQTLELMMVSVSLLLMYHFSGENSKQWRVDMQYGISLLKESWPLILAGLSVMLYMKIDIVMLKKMSGEHETGIYSAATRLSEGFYFIPMIIVSSLTPMLLKAKQTGVRAYEEAFRKLYLLMVRLGLLIAVTMTIMSPLLVDVLFGKSYAESAPVLQLHVWAAVAVFLGVASSQYLTNEGHQELSLYRTLAGLGINISLNFWFIPLYGAVGAAIATLISYFIATFVIGFTKTARLQVRMMLMAMHPMIVLGLRPVQS